MNNNNYFTYKGSSVPHDRHLASDAIRKARTPFWTFLSLAIYSWGSPAVADEAFFNTKVAPQLAQHQCANCHVANHTRPRVFEYRELLPYLAMGTSAQNNVLIAKMTNARHFLPNVASHPGGQRCNSIESEPCATFGEWWNEEFQK